MPELLPFAGLRPVPAVAGCLDDVVCPPYDVITEEQRQALLHRSPYNVVRVELPDGDYRGAARLLDEWGATGVLARESAPALYGYRMTYRASDGQTRHTLGVMGALVLEPPGQGILPHEHTTPKAKSDRLELIRATRCNTSPIWCLCSEPGLAQALGPVPSGPTWPGWAPAHATDHASATGAPVSATGAPVSATGAPVSATGAPVSATDENGNLHELWPIFSPAVHQAVAGVIAARPLLVADGHHRYETALAYQAEQRQKSPGPARGRAGYDAVLCYVVELAEEHLQVLAIHRVVSGLPAGTDVLGALVPVFELSPTDARGPALLARMADVGALAVVTGQATYLASPRAEAPGTGPDLDSRRADAAVHHLPPHRLAYEHDVPAALAAVGSGAADAAILCRPAGIDQIARTAHGGARMPPKTTFFWPKLRTGMVLRDFEGL
jgi:uncharacterized protein (DUF1015 family)